MSGFEYVFTYRWTHPDGTPVTSTGTASSDDLLDEDGLKHLVLEDQSRGSGVPLEDIEVSRFLYSAAPFLSEEDMSRPGTGQVWLDSSEDIT